MVKLLSPSAMCMQYTSRGGDGLRKHVNYHLNSGLDLFVRSVITCDSGFRYCTHDRSVTISERNLWQQAREDINGEGGPR